MKNDKTFAVEVTCTVTKKYVRTIQVPSSSLTKAEITAYELSRKYSSEEDFIGARSGGKLIDESIKFSTRALGELKI